MSTEKQRRLPSTAEMNALIGAEQGIEHLVGTVLLDRYRLIQLLGSGGAAVVYRAEHTLMHKAVAVKILRPELAQRQDFVQRFLAEARTVARLRHENIVDIADLGRTETGLVFCVMEYLEGEELGVTLEREGRLPWPRARTIITQLCRALAAAHAAGVVHRDVKPQNCFRVRHGANEDFIKLLDFGISKQLDSDRGLTATGMIMGTAEYMSPEQARGRDVDARTDIYAVGAMLFELLAGRAPFEGQTFLDVLMKHASEPVPKVSSFVAGLDTRVDALLTRALAKDPAHRFQTVQELVAALDAIADNTFVGLLDTRGLGNLDARPDSVLPRAMSSRATSGEPRPWQVATAAASAIVLVGLAFVLWQALSSTQDTEGMLLSDREESESGVASPTLDDSAEPAVVAASDSEGPDETSRGPAPAGEQPVPVPTADSLQPALVETEMTETRDAAGDIGVPDVSPEAGEKPATPTRPRAPSRARKAKPSAKSVQRLKGRIAQACGEHAVDAEQPVVVEVTGEGFLLSRVGYRALKKCIAQLGHAGLESGQYAMIFTAKAN